jgi:hypothetical protein
MARSALVIEALSDVVDDAPAVEAEDDWAELAGVEFGVAGTFCPLALSVGEAKKADTPLEMRVIRPCSIF